MEHRLAVIGAGNMAEAIVRGVLVSGLMAPHQIVASDISAQRRELFEKQLAVRAVEDNLDAITGATTVILAVKPQQMAGVLEGLKPHLDPAALIISIAAGVSSAFIEAQLGAERPWRVVRTMPNTPMLVGDGMVVIAPGRQATSQDIETARAIFQSGATVLELPEDKMDIVTAVSGSGPAYFFFLVEQMIEAGVEAGLTREQAHTLATRTAAGAAKMLVSSSDSPAELRRKVTSPGGTTQAAIEAMQAGKVDATIRSAVLRAAERSRELGAALRPGK